MVVLLDLDEEATEGPHTSDLQDLRRYLTCPEGQQSQKVEGQQSQKDIDEEQVDIRLNPNVGGFSSAVACYPYVYDGTQKDTEV